MATTGLETAQALLGLINGGKDRKATTTTTSGGGKQTQQTQLSDAAVQEQIQRILAGSGGVRDIGNAARRSGLYNSTTEELLLGNLYSNAAAQGEIARAPTVTTSAPTTTTATQVQAGQGGGIGDLAMLIGGGLLADQAFKFFDGAMGNITRTGSSSLLDEDLLGNGAVSFGAGPDSAIGLSFGAGSTPSNANVSNFSANLGQGQYGIGDTQGSSTGGTKGSQDFNLLGAITSGLSGLFSGAGDIGSSIGSVVSGGFGGGGGGAGASSASVICTALKEKGELDAELHAKGSAYLASLDPLTVLGYQLWAVAVASKIRKGSKLAMVLTRPVARSRTGLLATHGTFRDHLNYPLGTITKYFGEPVCKLIGKAAVTFVMHKEINAALKAA